jgi:hypothetical protein
MNTQEHNLKKIRLLILLFMTGLIISGVTAFPIQSQLQIAHDFFQQKHWDNMLTTWLEKVYEGVTVTYERYPFIAYGTDWLAFAHLVIAVAFVGPLKDPVRNIWVIQFGMIACIAVFPLAFIAGEVRGIPIFWRIIDCSFGLIGGLLLWSCYKKIKPIEDKVIQADS